MSDKPKKVRTYKDENGTVIEKGHIIQGVYGIPGRVIVASVRDDGDGKLYCLTPNHTPGKSSIASLIRNLGSVLIIGDMSKRGAKTLLAQDYGPRKGSGV